MLITQLYVYIHSIGSFFPATGIKDIFEKLTSQFFGVFLLLRSKCARLYLDISYKLHSKTVFNIMHIRDYEAKQPCS